MKLKKSDSAAFKNFYEIVEEVSKKYTDAVAFSYSKKKERKTKTFGQTYKDIQNVISWLRQNDLIGKKIALIGATDYEWVVCFLAVLYSGSLVVPMNYAENVEELQRDIEFLEVDALLYGKLDEEQVEWANRVAKKTQDVYTVVNDTKNHEEVDFSGTSSKAPACIMFTTGSTGKKKGVVLSQENVIDLYEGVAETFHTEHVKGLAPLPNFHLMKMASIVFWYTAGVEQYLEGNLKRALKDIQEQKPFVVVITPVMMDVVRNILQADGTQESVKEKLKLFDENLKVIITGGAFSNPDTITFFEDHGIHVNVFYGMTEAGLISSIREDHKKQGSVGEIFPWVETKIVDGEIQVKGRSIACGYYKDPEGTNAVFHDGWVHTGDLGYVDEEGYLFLTGRKKNLIILANGENVSPEELEEQLSNCEEIQEVLVKEKNGHLHAEIFPNETSGKSRAEQEEAIETFVQNMNRENVMCKRIVSWSLRDTPFEKVNGMKIKRN